MGTRKSYPADFKLKVLEDYNLDGAIAGEVAAKHGLDNANLVYRWQSSRKHIEKAAKRLIQDGAKTAAKTNGNGHTEPVQAKTPLQITGLTPLIRELVKLQIDQLLPGLVAEKMKAGFTIKPS